MMIPEAIEILMIWFWKLRS